MTTINDLSAAYRVLELPFGAPLTHVLDAYRTLTQLYHPDRYKRGTQVYERALQKQKALNNARDAIREWFKSHPNEVPPEPKYTNDDEKSEPQPKPTPEPMDPKPDPQPEQDELHEPAKSFSFSHASRDNFQHPERIRTLRDWILERFETKRHLIGDTPAAKILLYIAFWLGPLGLFVLAASGWSPTPNPDEFAVILIILSIFTTINLFLWYGDEVQVWLKETKTTDKHSPKLSTSLFLDLGDRLSKHKWKQVQWNLIDAVFQNDHKSGQLHMRAKLTGVTAFPSMTFDQKVECVIEIAPATTGGTWISTRHIVNAPGTRQFALELIKDLNKLVDEVATS